MLFDTTSIINESVQSYFYHFLLKSFSTINPNEDLTPNWHLELMCDALENVRKQKIKRLIINIPPRHLKSICTSVAFPAWILAQNPAQRIIVASYSMSLATKHSVDTRRIMESQWYGDLFPDAKILNGDNTKTKFLTQSNGYRFATSVGGTLTGEGGDILIADDPHNPSRIYSKRERQKAIDWFCNTFSSRLNNKKKGSIVIVMQRLHEEDLTGYLQEIGGWDIISLPAIFEKKTTIQFHNKIYKEIKENELLHDVRESIVEIERVKKELGVYAFSSQYLQNPISKGGNLIKEEWLNIVDMPIQKGLIFISIDCANCINETSDFTVIATFLTINEKIFLIDMIRQKLEYPEIRDVLKKNIKKHNPVKVIIENKSSGISLIQELEKENIRNIVKINPKNDKQSRAMLMVSVIEKQELNFVKEVFSAELKEELLQFPISKHDDQIDTISQFVNWYYQNYKNMISDKKRVRML